MLWKIVPNIAEQPISLYLIVRKKSMCLSAKEVVIPDPQQTKDGRDVLVKGRGAEVVINEMSAL